MFHLRWIFPPPPKPFYYRMMNPEERVIWQIIGEQKPTSYRNKKGKVKTRKLSKEEIAHNQKLFFDNRCGKGIIGDDWMRRDINEINGRARRRRRAAEIFRESGDAK